MPVESATGAITLLQTILSGGPLLILAVLVVVEGYVIYKMANQINTLESEFRESSIDLLQNQIKQAEPLTQALTRTHEVLSRVDDALQNCSEITTRVKTELDIEKRARND
jgi:hypothetical protein